MYVRAKDQSVYEGEWHRDQRCGYGTLSVPQSATSVDHQTSEEDDPTNSTTLSSSDTNLSEVKYPWISIFHLRSYSPPLKQLP